MRARQARWMLPEVLVPVAVLVGVGAAVVAAMTGCQVPQPRDRSEGAKAEAAIPSPAAAPPQDASLALAPPPDAATPEPDDPMALHVDTTDELLALVAIPAPDAGAGRFDALLRSLLGPVPGRFNLGNRAIARHGVGRRACLESLKGIVIQTEEQRNACHGMENMVPLYTKGDPATAKTCIDVFEFPNKACELPLVWGTPSEADRLCKLEGKRLCTQGEWNLACKGDPAGKADWTYAYGNDLDLAICNTNKPHPMGPDGQWVCSARSAQSAWATCATETEPSGAFPKCRSRFGVFDQHGNVAEMMTRKGADGVVYTQLKGSAFFYVDVERLPTEAQKPGTRETYPDHCDYDPRWHVEVLESALHSNYHLGFRCCLSL